MEKTEAPTQRRLRRALREGDSPISIPLVRTGTLITAVCLLPSAAGALRVRFDELLRIACSKPETITPVRLAEDVTLLAGPVVVTAAVVAFVVGLIQTSGVVAFQKIAPRFDRLNPGSNLAQGWGGQRPYDAIRGFVVTTALLLVGAHTLLISAPELAFGVSGEHAELDLTAGLGLRLLWFSVAVLVATSAVDLAVKRRAWIRRWRMSRRDVAEEKKRKRRRSRGQASETTCP